MNIFVGLITGAAASMGLGGGFVLLVYLSIFTNTPQDLAQGINLLFFLPIALLSLIIHVGSFVAGIIDVEILRKLFAAFLLYIGISQLFSGDKKSEFTDKSKPDNE